MCLFLPTYFLLAGEAAEQPKRPKKPKVKVAECRVSEIKRSSVGGIHNHFGVNY